MSSTHTRSSAMAVSVLRGLSISSLPHPYNREDRVAPCSAEDEPFALTHHFPSDSAPLISLNLEMR